VLSPDKELVLVVPTALLYQLGYFQGFCHETARYLPRLLEPANLRFMSRAQAENDPQFKQLIPYIIFTYQPPDEPLYLFQYTRGKGQGEARLHLKRSVGVGGHISSGDCQTAASAHPYYEGLRRELEEEVRIQTPYRHHCVGLINDDQTEVGRVHLGIVYRFDCQKPAVFPRETEIRQSGFMPLERILAELDQFETWSQISVRALFSGK